MPFNMEKDLPSLPGDLTTDTGKSPTLQAPRGLHNIACPRPTPNLEKHLSPEELALLHDRWNEATSARQIRFERQPAQQDHLRSAPLPAFEAENVPRTISHANNSLSTATPQKRWGLFTRKNPVDAAKSDEQTSKSSKPFRGPNFLNRAKAAKSTPNLNAAAKALAQKVSPPVPPVPCELSTRSSVIEQPTAANAVNNGDKCVDASQELGIDPNDGGIYLTLDAEWRSSSGDAVLTFLSPIPDEIPDSPLIYCGSRRHSLGELQSFQSPPMCQATRNETWMDPIDELHSFLEV